MQTCLSVNFFSNRIGSLSFYPSFPICGLNVQNNVAPKTEELDFFFLLISFSTGFISVLVLHANCQLEMCSTLASEARFVGDFQQESLGVVN